MASKVVFQDEFSEKGDNTEIQRYYTANEIQTAGSVRSSYQGVVVNFISKTNNSQIDRVIYIKREKYTR